MTTGMVGRGLGFCLGVLFLAYTSSALAGPIEVFSTARVASGNPDRLVVRYQYGDGGMYFSDDRGASFGIGCFRPLNPMIMDTTVQAFTVTTDGSVCAGTGSALYCSNAQGCGWKEATEIKGEWIADFAEDPLDPKVMYLATSTASKDPMMPRENGLWRRATPDAAWEKFGKQLPGWFSRVHVVKNADGRRIVVSAQETTYATDPMTMAPKEQVQYYVRYSDDDGATWTSNAFDQKADGMVRLFAVNPANPNEVVVAVRRTAPLTPDDLYYSPMLGMAGTYQKIASPIEVTSAVFTPDGKLYFGDNEQTTPGLFEVAKLGDAPKQLSAAFKVGCLAYDAPSDRLYVCADWRFGTADRASGELAVLFNMKETTDVHVCEGEPDLKETCGPALRSPNFCDITHYPDAPLCQMYFPATPVASTRDGGAGAAVSGAAGSSGATGTAGSAGAPVSIGTAGSAGSSNAPPTGPAAGSGGGCSSVPGQAARSGFALLSLLVLVAAGRRRKRR